MACIATQPNRVKLYVSFKQKDCFFVYLKVEIPPYFGVTLSSTFGISIEFLESIHNQITIYKWGCLTICIALRFLVSLFEETLTWTYHLLKLKNKERYFICC